MRPKTANFFMNRFKIRNESKDVTRKLRFDRSPPAARTPQEREAERSGPMGFRQAATRWRLW